jgi:hypothetical protein
LTVSVKTRALAGITPDGLAHIDHQFLSDVARGPDIPARNRVIERGAKAAELGKVVVGAIIFEAQRDLADSIEVSLVKT